MLPYARSHSGVYVYLSSTPFAGECGSSADVRELLEEYERDDGSGYNPGLGGKDYEDLGNGDAVGVY